MDEFFFVAAHDVGKGFLHHSVAGHVNAYLNAQQVVFAQCLDGLQCTFVGKRYAHDAYVYLFYVALVRQLFNALSVIAQVEETYGLAGFEVYVGLVLGHFVCEGQNKLVQGIVFTSAQGDGVAAAWLLHTASDAVGGHRLGIGLAFVVHFFFQ